MGRGGESGGRGGESSAEIAETKEAPAAAELQSGVSPACVRASGAPLGQRTAHPFGAGRQGPCGRQAGSPGGHRDPRAQWRGRQQNRQHCRDHPQPERSKCPRPGGYAIIPLNPHPRQAPGIFLQRTPAPGRLPRARPLPLLCGFLCFSASPFSPPPPAGRDPRRCGAHGTAAG